MVEVEIIRHEQIRGLHVFINGIRMRSLHVHHDMELLYILKGSGTVSIREKNFSVSSGDILLISAFDAHEFRCMDEGITCVIVQMSNHFLREYFPSIRNIRFQDTCISDVLSPETGTALRKDILALADVYIRRETFFELSCVRTVSDILLLLLENTSYEVLEEEEYSRRKKTNQRFARISSYIESNYQDQIRLIDIAEQEGITVTHLSHIFKEYFGMGFQEYIRRKRLEHALRLLSDHSLTLSDIAAVSGFSELKYMTSAFKDAFGESPEIFRKRQVSSYETKEKRRNEPEHIYSREEALLLLQTVIR